MNLTNKIKSYILSNLKEGKNKKIGVEVEGIFYFKHPLKRIPVNIAKSFSASTLLDEISKMNSSLNYSMEPGGQIEWASSPFSSLWDIKKEFDIHLKNENYLCSNYNIKRMPFSLEPIFSPKDIDLVNQKKYKLMNRLFKKMGNHGQWMMRNTASVQLNIDYSSEKEANEMAYIADVIQPLYSILFSNSPFMNGCAVKSKNMRWIIWNDTDKNRCGSLFSKGINKLESIIDDYINYIKKLETIFIQDESGHVIEFKGSLAEMINSDPENEKDLILSAFRQVFTHVRFKSVLEIRGSDRPLDEFELSPAAFMAGLLTNNSSREILLEMINNWSQQDIINLNETAKDLSFSNIGPEGKSIGHWLEKLAELSIKGLDSRSLDFGIENERPLLESYLNDILNNGSQTVQIQKKFKKSNLSLNNFISNYTLD